MNIPNILTLLRIVLIPVFAVVFYLPFEWARFFSAVIFVLAAVTDWLDGYLARKLDQASALGAFLDPVADKLMVAVVLIILLQQHPTLWLAIPTAIIISREITISALREWMAEIGARSQVAVSMLGKIKTTAQMVAITCLIYQADIGLLPIYTIGYVLLYIAAILTVWSMCLYISAAWPMLTENKD